MSLRRFVINDIMFYKGQEDGALRRYGCKMKKLEDYKKYADFHEPGIIFRDVTTVLQDKDGLKLAIDSIQIY